MGSATSSIPPEPFLAAAAVAGAVGYGYVHFVRPAAHSGEEDTYSDAGAGASKTTASTLRGQKKRGRKLQLPGDATLKNLDILDALSVPGSLTDSISAPAKTRERQRQLPPQQKQQQQQREAPSRDAVPGGFDGAADDARDTQPERSQPPLEAQPVQQQQQQHVSVGATKKPKKKKGKKTPAAASTASDPSSVSAVGTSPSLAATPASGTEAADGHDERWTRVEARKKKVAVPPQDGVAEVHSAEATAADVTTSDAGVTTSVTGNSSPVTERTTEDELRSERSELDECVFQISSSALLHTFLIGTLCV